MSRSGRALARSLLAASVWAGTAGAAGTSVRDGDALRLGGDVLRFPATTLLGGVGIETHRVTLPADVLFGFGSARLTPRARAAIAVTAGVLRDRRPTTVRVIGYTDDRGSESYNVALSQRRAVSVRRALLAHLGPAAPTLHAEGRGERDPVAANSTDGRDDPKGRARNRRVEVLLR